MWTLKYKGYYVNGYHDRDECTALCSPTGFGATWRRKCKSLRAAKIAITAHLNP